MRPSSNSPRQNNTGGIDRFKLRLGFLTIVIIAAFVGLFSRLWFLQVLASDQYRGLAKDNRVRFVYSEPPRGAIVDRDGKVIVDSTRKTLALTLDRDLLDSHPRQKRLVFHRLAGLLDESPRDLAKRFIDPTVSPYKPVAVAYNVTEDTVSYISEHKDRFPGVDSAILPLRHYPQGELAANILGWVGQISADQLKSPQFKGVRPPYAAGDLVGKAGLELTYDRYLRGAPGIEKVTVNSSGELIGHRHVQDEEPGRDLVTSLDVDVQRAAENALVAGAKTAHSRAGAVVVMDPDTGGIVAMASLPTYRPSTLADGISTEEYAALGGRTPDDPDDDALLNRAIQAQRQPGSTFKVVTAGAALSTGVATTATVLGCPPAVVYPPGGGSGSVVFHNYTSSDLGSMGFARSLEVSCDTFYYELGWRLEDAFGAADGDGTEKYQKYARTAGFGHPTGIDLPNEASGRVPDLQWCKDNADIGYCPDGWVPGYTVNMAIGQGDLIVTPLQMAVTYAAIANGGTVVQPQLGWGLGRPDPAGGEQVLRNFKGHAVAHLPLTQDELAVIQQGLKDVVSGGSGTARSAFVGFPLDRYPVAGKTGTAQLGETGLNDAWFISYAPANDPKYVIAVYLEKQKFHGGEVAAPIARQIYENIFHIDQKTQIGLGQDVSG
jgi:penicillin-binding protein 2